MIFGAEGGLHEAFGDLAVGKVFFSLRWREAMAGISAEAAAGGNSSGATAAKATATAHRQRDRRGPFIAVTLPELASARKAFTRPPAF